MKIPLPKLRELKEAVLALLRGPYTDKFPAGEARVARNYRGFPRFYTEQCVGCGACFNVCPARAIDMDDNRETKTRKLTLCIDRCITCGQCQAYCITQEGIKLTREYDLTTTRRMSLRERAVEKDLVVCESCDEIVGAREHLVWIARRLGPLAFSNPALFLASVQAGAAATPRSDFEKGLRRGDKLRILCPRCRQEVSFLA